MIKDIVIRYRALKVYLDNTFWILGDKFLGLGVGFLVTVVVARYLGPGDFGMYAYVMSLVSLFSVVGHMGLSGLVVREIVKTPNDRGAILGTSITLKMIGMVVGYLGLLVYAYYYEGIESVEFLLIAIAGIILLLSCFDVMDYWFQSFVQAKYVSISNLIALFVSSGAKLIFVFLGLSLTYFVIASVVQGIILGLSLLFLYLLKSGLPLRNWSFSWSKAKELVSQGWIVYLGSIFAILNLKLDQVMLKWYKGVEEVGIYSVAAQLSEAWYFIPTAIVASFFPRLIVLKNENFENYQARLQGLFDILFLIALAVAILVSIGGELLIMTFFGDQYISSANVLIIHVWAAIFIFMRALFSRWILIEGVLIFSLLTQAIGAIVNVILNYFWINQYGAIGAAYATLISYMCSSFIALCFYKRTRPIFWMMCKAIVMHSFVIKSFNK
jgi:O-antigen/teichoic acid export membrane protein